MKQVKYPCRNCMYFKVCGENMRMMPCNGRKIKSSVKRESAGLRIKE